MKLGLKTQAQAEADFKKVCNVEGCDSPITPYCGPGGRTLCFEHQQKLRENGGRARRDRHYTFHKSSEFKCNNCGQSVADPIIDVIPEPLRSEIKKLIYHGDHRIQRSKGGSDHKDNIQDLCYVCHAVKTVYERADVDFAWSLKAVAEAIEELR